MNRVILPTLLMMVGLLASSAPARATILTFDIYDQDTDISSCQFPVSECFPEGSGVGTTPDPLTGYGDNVTGNTTQSNGGVTFTYGYGVAAEGYTPNVTVDYGPYSIFTGGPVLWRYDYGDLVNVLYQGSTGTVGNNYNHLDIVFTAGPGYDVELYGFDLGGWFETDYTINAVVVYDGLPFPFLTPTNQIDTQSNVLVKGAGPASTSITYTAPLKAQQIWLTIDATNLGDLSELIGIDNIRFGQVANPNNTEIPPPNLNDIPDRFAVPEPASSLLLGIGLAAVGVVRRRKQLGS